MHLPSSPFALAATLLVPCALAQQVTLSSPDLSKPVDLARNVTIAWTITPTAPEEREDQVDIWYHEKKQGFGYELVANHSNALGDGRQFVWDPSDVLDALMSVNNSISKGRFNEFRLKFHGRNTSSGSSIYSKEFEVVGPPSLRMSAAGRAFVGGWEAAMVGGAAVGLGVLML